MQRNLKLARSSGRYLCEWLLPISCLCLLVAWAILVLSWPRVMVLWLRMMWLAMVRLLRVRLHYTIRANDRRDGSAFIASVACILFVEVSLVTLIKSVIKVVLVVSWLPLENAPGPLQQA